MLFKFVSLSDKELFVLFEGLVITLCLGKMYFEFLLDLGHQVSTDFVIGFLDYLGFGYDL